MKNLLDLHSVKQYSIKINLNSFEEMVISISDLLQTQ